MLTNVDVRLFILVWMLWFGSEILLNRKFRSSDADQKGQDKGSIRVLWIGLLGGNALAVLASMFFTSSTLRISSNPQIAYAGLVVTVIGMLFRFYAVWSLGRNFTVDVTIREDHKLHTQGVYGLIRHPSYTGMIISFIGFGISMNTWPGLIAVCVF
ncbi:MAG: isoprenylcysteine carboxylmethyltransferase family protein, partial [Flavobacteriales bacterium]|nr:isoprenylcysteine carboxylmethyltransferase family protein [Flavobacteriales bacterium]